MAKEKKSITTAEAGQKGGATTSRKYGPEFYQEIGQKGGRVVSEKYGPDFYHKIGTMGGHKVRDLIKKAKESSEG